MPASALSWLIRVKIGLVLILAIVAGIQMKMTIIEYKDVNLTHYEILYCLMTVRERCIWQQMWEMAIRIANERVVYTPFYVLVTQGNGAFK